VVNYPPRPDNVLKCEGIIERVLSPIIVWKNANHQAEVKATKFLRNRQRFPLRRIAYCVSSIVDLEAAKNLRSCRNKSQVTGNSFLT
jgi:hypothetical protein